MLLRRIWLTALAIAWLPGPAGKVHAAPISMMFDRIEDGDESDKEIRLRLIGEFQSGRHLRGTYDFSEVRSPESFQRMGRIAASTTIDAEVAQAALKALGEVKHDGAIAPLLEIAKNDKLPEATRVSACKNLGKHVKRGVVSAVEGLVILEKAPTTPEAVRKAAQGELKVSGRLKTAALKAIAGSNADGRGDAEDALGKVADLDNRLSPEDNEQLEQWRQDRIRNLEVTIAIKQAPAVKARLTKIRKMKPFDLALADFTYYCEATGLVSNILNQLDEPDGILISGRTLDVILYEERVVKSIDGDVTETLVERSVDTNDLNPWLRHKDYWAEVEKVHHSVQRLSDEGVYALKQAYLDQIRKRKK